MPASPLGHSGYALFLTFKFSNFTVGLQIPYSLEQFLSENSRAARSVSTPPSD